MELLDVSYFSILSTRDSQWIVRISSLTMKLSFSIVSLVGDGQCMREWLKIAGAQTSSLNALEEKARYYQLSESRIRREHKAILKLLLPANVVEKLKVCTGIDAKVDHCDNYVYLISDL